MIRMRVKSVSVGIGPIPSAITLQAITPHENAHESEDTPLVTMSTLESEKDSPNLDSTPNMLPIRIGMADSAAIAAAVESTSERPLTHTLLANTIQALDGELQSVSITRVEETTFFATLDIKTSDGALHHIDARPSDAIALALQTKVDILASEELLEQAGSPDFEAIAHQEHQRQAEEFHDFVESLSPEDFAVHRDN